MSSASPPRVKGAYVRPTSAWTKDRVTASGPAPPYSSGVSGPPRPDLRALARDSGRASSRPGEPSRSRRRTSGSSGCTSRSRKRRTVSTMVACSSVGAKSTAISARPRTVEHGAGASLPKGFGGEGEPAATLPHQREFLERTSGEPPSRIGGASTDSGSVARGGNAATVFDDPQGGCSAHVTYLISTACFTEAIA